MKYLELGHEERKIDTGWQLEPITRSRKDFCLKNNSSGHIKNLRVMFQMGKGEEEGRAGLKDTDGPVRLEKKRNIFLSELEKEKNIYEHI